jgi:putative flippase GtrA
MTSPPAAPRPPAAPIIGQLAKYGVVGISNSLIGFAIYVAAVKLGVQYLIASTLAYAVGSVNGYFLNRRWTFRGGGLSRASSAGRYAAVQVAALVGNLVLLYALVHLVGVEKIVGQAIVVAIVFLSTFAANRVWSFTHRGAHDLAAHPVAGPGPAGGR